MHLCIFNPEHDLCMAKGRAHYVPPRSAVDFARRDAGLMQVLYPEAVCMSVYDPRLSSALSGGQAFRSAVTTVTAVTAWGWNAVVKHELLKRGIQEGLLPSDKEIDAIRELQHRTTVLPLQPDCREVHSAEEMAALLGEREHWVMKAPWSGAGRGLRWVHGRLTPIDSDWLKKTVAAQRCVVAEPRREVVADVALEYMNATFFGYSYFKTGSGVYKENVRWTDGQIEAAFPLRQARERIEPWLNANVWPRYHGPLGVDLMVCADGSVHVAEMNVRHTMGMVAHEELRVKS